MKKIAFTLSVLLASTAAAMAADLPARTYTKAPPMADPVYNWTGFYLGGDVGGGWARTNINTAEFFSFGGTPSDPQTFTQKTGGALAGLHAGYNWQTSSALVLGVEGDGDWAGIRGNSSPPLTFSGVPSLGTTNTLARNVNWLASIRGRIGYTGGNWLVYATGGFAMGGLEFSAAQNQNFGSGGIYSAFSSSSTRNGWVAGAGIEYAFSRNWILRGEYLYYSFGGTTGTALEQSYGNVRIVGFPGFNDAFGRTDVQTARVGISYKFGGPVVAKY